MKRDTHERHPLLKDHDTAYLDAIFWINLKCTIAVTTTWTIAFILMWLNSFYFIPWLFSTR